MAAINLIFEVNYAAFSVFATLLITEIMGAVLLLIAWDAARKRVLDYVVPMWEITGTFGALWVVTGYFAYPSLLVPVASIFAPLLIVFLLLFVARNTSISFAEFILKRGWLDEEKLYKAYAISTVVLGLIVLVLLSSLVGGQGVNLPKGTFSLASWATAGNLLFVVGTLALAVGLAPAFYDLPSIRKLILPFGVAGMAISVLAFYAMSPALVTGWISVPVLLTLIAALLYLWPKTTRIVANKAVFILVVSVIVFSLQSLIYPKVIGQALSIDAFTTGGVMATTFYTITVVGSMVLGAMLVLYVAVAYRGTGGPDSPLASR